MTDDTTRGEGIPLRDFFAGQALAGLCNGPRQAEPFPGWQANLAWNAYSIADAMLAERTNKKL